MSLCCSVLHHVDVAFKARITETRGCHVTADGSAWMMGKSPSPTPLPDCRAGWMHEARPESMIVAVNACEGVILAAITEGQLLSCGLGAALGLGHEAASKGAVALTAVSGLPPVCSFSMGSLHAVCMGRDDGSVWCWGDGD